MALVAGQSSQHPCEATGAARVTLAADDHAVAGHHHVRVPERHEHLSFRDEEGDDRGSLLTPVLEALRVQPLARLDQHDRIVRDAAEPFLPAGIVERRLEARAVGQVGIDVRHDVDPVPARPLDHRQAGRHRADA